MELGGTHMSSSGKAFTFAGDPLRVLRAILTNQLARFAPSTYVRLTGQTGRGKAEEEGVNDIARYFRECVEAYFGHLGVASGDVPAYLANKVMMEYGPGDLPGVAALMVAKGASKVYCVDRFPLVNLSPKNAKVIADLMASCSEAERARLRACLVNPENPEAGFASEYVEYLVRPSGLSGLSAAVDLVISRAVLEHVNDIQATFLDMVRAMRPGAIAVHQVDLRSHGLHKANQLDFLAWSPRLWHWMYSAKGVPNRCRIDVYRGILSELPVSLLGLEPTETSTLQEVRDVRSVLAAPFRALSDEDLAWLGAWIVFRKDSARTGL